MKKGNFYMFVISPNTGEYQLDLFTDYEILKDDVVNFGEHPDSEFFLKEYNTVEFTVVQRKLYWADTIEEQHIILTIEPLK